MTNRPDCVFKSGVINCGISDYDSVYMIKKWRVPTPKLPPGQDFECQKFLEIRS